MQQVEAGQLELDRDVNDYLDFRIPPRDGKPITLRNLMTHTPGFEEPIKRLVTDRPEQLATPEQYLKAWIPRRIYPAGEVPAYSNYGVTLAGYIVERVTGERYDDYVERHVFAPLGMTQSTTRQVLPAHFRAHMSQGYLLGSGGAAALRAVWRRAGRRRDDDGRRHGPVHDRLAAGAGSSRAPASCDAETVAPDARHAAAGHAAAQQHAARVLRTGLRRATHRGPRRGLAVLPQFAEPLPG